MPIFPLLLALTQVGTDAKPFYEDMQRRIAKAGAIKHRMITGIDSDVTVIFVPPNKFVMGSKNYLLQCDGKWLLEQDTGDVTHRPYEAADLERIGFAKPIPGLEALFPGHKPLDVFGKIENGTHVGEFNNSSCWKINYRTRDGEKTLDIDPKTSLPLYYELADKINDARFTVPPYRKAEEVFRRAQKALGTGLISLIRYTRDRGTQETITEAMQINRDGTVRLEPYDPRKNSKLTMRHGKWQWTSAAKTVPAKTLNLRGLESLTHTPLPKLKPLIKLNNFDGAKSGNYLSWQIPLSYKGDTVNVYYDKETNLPNGYELLQDKKHLRTVSYLINPPSR